MLVDRVVRYCGTVEFRLMFLILIKSVVYMIKARIEGSNPSLSAKYKEPAKAGFLYLVKFTPL